MNKFNLVRQITLQSLNGPELDRKLNIDFKVIQLHLLLLIVYVYYANAGIIMMLMYPQVYLTLALHT